jgi:flagellar biosynthetic protein FlhB
MADEQGEKSQDPTPHRRQKAREEGQVAKSQDLASAVLLLVATVSLLMLGAGLVGHLASVLQTQLSGPAWLSVDENFAVVQWNGVMFNLAQHVLPLLVLIMLAGIAINLAQGGFLYLPDKLVPDVSRLDPIKGFQRIFSMSSVARLGFGIFKVVVVASVAAVVLYKEREMVLGLAALSLPQIAAYLAEVLLWTTIKIGGALLILALLDYGFQWWKQEQDLKMTSQEVREEMRQLEGDPQVAARRRQVQRQLVLNRMGDAVPKADVVVTNPTELAIAIQYDPEKMAAPVVLAKGAGYMAERIRRIALEHGIPIVERKPLAQALYKEVEINHPVPHDKYAAVAEVLAYVYHLKGKKMPKRREGWE